MTVVADQQAPAPQPPVPGSGPPVRGHLSQIDVVRVLTFACVVGVHAMSSTVVPSSSTGGAILMLLHFTREAFFLVTGFVLVHTYGSRPHLDVRAFWTRRFLLVGVPYVVWSLIYYGVNVPITPDRGLWWRTLGFDLITGRASYQMYFLLVSLQAYLLLPLILKLLRRTAGRHLWLLGASLVLELVTLQLIQGTQHATGWALVILLHVDVMFPTYQLFLLVGGVMAWNLPRIQAVIQARRRWVPWIVLAGAGLAELAFFLQIPAYGAEIARGQLQPVMVPWSIAIFLGLYALGLVWAAQPRTGSWAAVLDVGSRASFGIYLVHPMVLDLLFAHGFLYGPGQVVPPWLATISAVVIATAAATVVVLLVQRTPFSSMLTGREQDGGWQWRWVTAAVALTVALVITAGITQHALLVPPAATN